MLVSPSPSRGGGRGEGFRPVMLAGRGPEMNEESIFAAALEKGNPAERAAYLDEACAGDPALRSEVEALLQSHQEAGSFLEQPVLGQPTGTADGGDPSATRTELSGEDSDELSLDFLE